MMIELNHRPYPYREAMTISTLMAENNFDFNAIIAKINGIVIEDSLWEEKLISPGDKVEIIHVFGGG